MASINSFARLQGRFTSGRRTDRLLPARISLRGKPNWINTLLRTASYRRIVQTRFVRMPFFRLIITDERKTSARMIDERYIDRRRNKWSFVWKPLSIPVNRASRVVLTCFGNLLMTAAQRNKMASFLTVTKGNLNIMRGTMPGHSIKVVYGNRTEMLDGTSKCNRSYPLSFSGVQWL